MLIIETLTSTYWNFRYIVAYYAGWPTLVTLWSILLSTGVSVTVGVLSGLYPARRASELDPAVALGYE